MKREKGGLLMNSKNLLHLVQPEMQRLIAEGLQQDEFKMYYDPVIDIKSDVVSLFDLSICWHHERYGVLEAIKFIPLIKQLPEYEQFAHRFFECVSRRLHFFESIDKLTALAIPVSAKQLKRDDGIDMLLQFLNAHDIPTSGVVLKIFNYAENLPEKLELLQETGFKIIVPYELRVKFKKLSVDYVLISRHEIEKKRLLGEPLLKETLKATLAKAHCQFIVHDIEEESHQLFLQQYGIRYFQGPFYSEPLPFEEMFKKLS